MKKIIAGFVLPLSLVLGLVFLFQSYEHVVNTETSFLEFNLERKKNKKPSFGFPDLATQQQYEMRAYPLGYIPVGWREEAMKHIEENNILATDNGENLAAFSWTQVGPTNVGGRVRSILINPSDANIIYAGAVSGGVWKTTTGGTSWVPLKDDMENLAVCAMTFQGTNANIIYAGTGEGFFNYDFVRGEGIFKSTDAGNSWTQLASTKNANFHYVNKLEYDRVNNKLYAATRKGVFVSTDGGATFTAAYSAGSNDINIMDIEIAYTSPVSIYATQGMFSGATIFRSTNNGASFTSIYTNANGGRVELAVSPSSPATVYASVHNPSTGGALAMIKSTNSGANWSSITIPGPSFSGASTYLGGQGWYDNILAVQPDNPNIVYAGGIDIFKTTNGGTSWTQISNWYSQGGAPPYVHADQHAMVFPSGSNTLYVGNDGGVYRTTNGGSSWTGLNNNLAITQFYYGAVHPTLNTFYGGTQDNGTIRSSSGTTWTEIFGGDGGATEVDFNNPNNIYIEYVNFSFWKSTNGGSSFFSAMSGIPKGPNTYDGTTDRTLFITPFAMDPNNPQIIVGGTYRVWKTTNGANNWNAVSNDLTGDGTGSSGARISAVSIAKGNSDVIYVGCTNGRVQVTTAGGTTWTNITSGLPNLSVSRIAIQPNQPNTAYVAYSGFSSGNKVYKTTNRGATWSNVSSNLPNIPINSIIVNHNDANHIIAGTDLGVFSTTNGGVFWFKDGSAMPNVPVYDLDIRTSDNKIVAATHGRSMFTATLPQGGSSGQTVNLIYDDGTPTSGYYFTTNGSGSAVRMSPPMANCKILTVSFYITSVNAGTATFKPIIYGSSGNSPGTALVNFAPVTASNTNAWNTWSVENSNLFVNTDFYVGMIYDGVNQPAYGYDPVSNNRGWDFENNIWSAYPWTYFMRASVQTPVGIVEFSTEIPAEYKLSQNYPNPFNPSTRIEYFIPEEGKISLEIFDINGNLVATIADNVHAAGKYAATWNGKSNSGYEASSGVYFARLKAEKFTSTIKMVLMR